MSLRLKAPPLANVLPTKAGVTAVMVHWRKAYIEDIVLASETLEQHVTDLHILLTCLKTYIIALQPIKAYIGFPSVSLLGHRVDALGMLTLEEKLKAIADLEFPGTIFAILQFNLENQATMNSAYF